jgi:hypothetical protein
MGLNEEGGILPYEQSWYEKEGVLDECNPNNE